MRKIPTEKWAKEIDYLQKKGKWININCKYSTSLEKQCKFEQNTISLPHYPDKNI